MKTKQQQKDEAQKAYKAIEGPAWKSYQAKLKEIDKQEEDIIESNGKRYKLIED